jgi:hypothetical protein
VKSLGLRSTGISAAAFTSSERLPRAHCEDVGNDRIPLGMFQVRAMRHAVYDLWPILSAVTPECWERVALDATVNKQRAAFAQHRKIGMATFDRPLRRDWRRRKTRRSTTAKIDKANAAHDPDR